MKHLSKVVWFEGMYLGPQHFQAQRQSFEDLVHFSSSNLWFEAFGWIGYKLDAEVFQSLFGTDIHITTAPGARRRQHATPRR